MALNEPMGAEGDKPTVRDRLQQRRREHPATLFTASAWAMLVLAATAFSLWVGLAWLLGDKWPWDLDATETTQYSVIRMVLFILAGVVGVVGVVVAYRRQHGAEQGRFLEQLAEGSRLLGDPNPTVQAAGIYALASLADSEIRKRRQQCVDVLCAYIRLPYAPAVDGPPNALETVMRTRTRQTRSGPIKEEHTVLRPHDRHTRETIIRVITQHLQPDADVSWSDVDLDFTSAVFDYGDFTGAIFTREVSFRHAQFAEGTVSFRNARFVGGAVRFDRAQFTGGIVSFDDAKFDRGTVSFWRAQLTGGSVDFVGAEFAGSPVDFVGTEFAGSSVYFMSSKFTGGTVNFAYATFTDGTVNFTAAKFSGGTVRLRSATLAGGIIDFRMPTDWSAPPQVAWDDDTEPPAGVFPESWPPEVDSE